MGDLSHLTDGQRKLGWGAGWLLPEEHRAAWGARAIADRVMLRPGEDLITPTHVADLLPDRQSGVGENEPLKNLLAWINKNVLPIRMNYDGSSREVTEVNDGNCHARWTPNGSYGYIYIVAWMD